jgi:ABC-type polysaccharide/polyol phosphate export permease
MHFGVFVEDLLNIVTVGLQLVFYLSGVFYDISDRLAAKHSRLCALLMYGNPVALIMTDIRNTLLYNQQPHFLVLGIWLVVCLIISVIGVKIIYKYENSYVKII